MSTQRAQTEFEAHLRTRDALIDFALSPVPIVDDGFEIGASGSHADLVQRSNAIATLELISARIVSAADAAAFPRLPPPYFLPVISYDSEVSARARNLEAELAASRREIDWLVKAAQAAQAEAAREAQRRLEAEVARDEAAPTSAVLDEIGRERDRVRDDEGFDAVHDDEHTDGSIACAAACYAMPEAVRMKVADKDGRSVPVHWPWSADAWKPGDRRRELIKAAQLIVAEIERLDRAR